MQRIPQEVAVLADRLRDHGAQLRTVSYDRPDNCVTDFAWRGRPVAVRIIADKGEWVVEIGRLDWEEFFDIEVWDAYFAGRPTPNADRSLAAQSAWVTADRLEEIERCQDFEAVNGIRATRMRPHPEPSS